MVGLSFDGPDSDAAMSSGDAWQVFLLLILILPLLACYVAILVWSCKRDRWKR